MRQPLSLKTQHQQDIDRIEYELRKLTTEAFLKLSEDDKNLQRYNLALFRSQQKRRNPWAYPEEVT